MSWEEQAFFSWAFGWHSEKNEELTSVAWVLHPAWCPLWKQREKAGNQWLRLWEQERTSQQACLLILRECPLYLPPESHWFQASVSSKRQFLIGRHRLHHQSLGSQTGFSLSLVHKLPLWLCGPTCCFIDVYVEVATALLLRPDVLPTHEWLFWVANTTHFVLVWIWSEYVLTAGAHMHTYVLSS